MTLTEWRARHRLSVRTAALLCLVAASEVRSAENFSVTSIPSRILGAVARLDGPAAAQAMSEEYHAERERRAQELMERIARREAATR